MRVQHSGSIVFVFIGMTDSRKWKKKGKKKESAQAFFTLTFCNLMNFFTLTIFAHLLFFSPPPFSIGN